MPEFSCATLSPLVHGGRIALATVRAGGVALIDVPDYADGAAIDRRVATLPEGDLGLRLTPNTVALAERLAGRQHRIILADWDAAALPALLARLALPGRAIWLETTGGDALADPALPFDGWLGRGSECGGRSGRESAFILAQRLAGQARPFWIQGGIGPHMAAACRVAGAAGVVLDDAVLLLAETGLPAPWRATLAELRGADTVALEAEGRPCRIANRHDLCGDPARIGWGDPAAYAWPVGQGIESAAAIAARHGTVGRLIQAVLAASRDHVAAAASAEPLAPDAPLAAAHGTRFPIVQGPMTRVSDTVPFAAAVAAAGALPMLALATMRGTDAASLLASARDTLGATPWGVGMLGYIPPELAAEQLAAVAEARPSFALIAGGRPDQAAPLDALGIPAYIHVASPELLRLYLDQGARRFVFEGAECGGHVGPLAGFALWEAMIAILAGWRGDTIDILFAGGIHDARSAAMIAAAAGGLGDAPVRNGVLMGSAYLFTTEAVAAGAIVPAFQQAAQAGTETVLIETRPGHRIRCLPTPFVGAFDTHRRALIGQGTPPAEIGDALEAAMAGRLRIASKAIERKGGALLPVDAARAHDQGVFMVGELAALRITVQDIAALHADVSEGATALIAAIAEADAAAAEPARPAGEPIAIIGIGCLLPGAQDPETLWRRLLDKAGATGEVPPERWDWRLYYDADQSARDRIYAKWGGFLDPVGFDHLRFGIPPNSLHSICVPQLLALEATRRALDDAGYEARPIADAVRERTAVIFGVGSAGDLEQMLKTRTALPLIGDVGEEGRARLPEWTEESYPGILLNVVAGRVANRFDMGGANFTVDAACASSLAALDLAVRELQSGRSDLALAGAIDAEMSPHAYTAFSKTQALSPSGRARPFDEQADGIVLAEGAVVLVLKRQSDAERDGDRIYAVIRGVAGSSDGKGLGLTAPKSAGQVRAFRRAHHAAGSDIAALGLYEAHATGTRVGDRVELETLINVMRGADAPVAGCAVGSAKALLGHTRSAAGMVGVVKAALSLHHRVLPPHAGVENPLPPLRAPDAPVYLLDEARAWSGGHAPRLAGVSAFGFGGTNFHAVIEEHGDPGPDGADRWPLELFALAAIDREAMLAAIGRLDRACASGARLRDLAAACAAAATGGPLRLALLAVSADELRASLAAARRAIAGGGAMPPGIAWYEAPVDGALAFLFPGQGSQACGMAAELALYLPEVRDAIERTDVARAIWPPASFTAEDRDAAERALTRTDVAQPAIVAVSCGMLDAATRIGLRPSRVAGHSLGEFVALHAAGAMPRDDLYRLAAARGRLMADIRGAGTMAVVTLDQDALAPYLAGSDALWIANRNAPDQIVVSGTEAAIDDLVARLAGDGHTARRLPVGGAFHSPLMRPARDALAAFLADGVALGAPDMPVHANLDGQPYPADAAAVVARCCGHLEAKVDFAAQVETMWQAGVRIFAEAGPGRALTGLTARILGDRPHLAVPFDGGMRGWLAAVARLWAAGQPVDLPALFAGRRIAPLDLDRLPPAAPVLEWTIDNDRVRRGDAPGLIGTAPFLDANSPVPAQGSDGIATAFGEYQQTMRQFLDQQERMLSRLLGERVAVPVIEAAPAPPIAAPEPVALETPGSAPLDRAGLLATVLALISERTGYPTDVLGPDQDLEADLGVDSIKRIEILGRFIKSQPPAIAAALQPAFDTLVRAKTPASLVEAVMRTVITAGAANQPGQAAPSQPAAPACPRFTMRATLRPLPALGRALNGLYLVDGGDDALAASVIAGLAARGAAAHRLTSADPAAEIAARRAAHGAVRGVIDLNPLEPGAAIGDSSRRLFAVLGACGLELANSLQALRLVSVAQSGGAWGRDGAYRGAPAGAGAHGLIQSVVRECPQVLAKTIDFDDAAPAAMAEAIVRETVVPGGGDEIGYRGGKRSVFHALAAPLGGVADESWRPGRDWVVLVTGGARGITAEICRELAAPGVRLAVVGRARDGEGSDAGERAANLAAFAAAGATVEYHAVDVADAAFGSLIDDLYRRHGRIDAVVHGAGIIEDQRFLAKTPESFARVFDTKARAAWTLARHLRPDTLKWLVQFGSVSGRFGNSGQADYAAANEAMARVGQWMNAQWPARIVTIEWGPWAGAGMAAEGVRQLLVSQGIRPIGLAAGRAFFVDELARGTKADAEVIAGEGPWALPSDEELGSVLNTFALLLGDRELEDH